MSGFVQPWGRKLTNQRTMELEGIVRLITILITCAAQTHGYVMIAVSSASLPR